MDGENNGKPYEKWDDLEVPLFSVEIHIGPGAIDSCRCLPGGWPP